MKLNIRHIILSFCFVTAVFLTSAQELYDYQSLSGKWYFTIGDNPDWARYHFNHYEWDQIQVPSRWEQEGFSGYDGFAWYRREVNISSSAKNKSLWLDMGYIDDADEVFINGKLINGSGSFPPKFKTAYNARRLYKIPAHVIRYDDTNVIAVRVYDSYHEGGIVSGDIGLKAEINPLLLDLPLEGYWKFKPGDKSYYKQPAYNDNNWNEIYVPRAWEAQGYDRYDGIAWYRKTTQLPEALKNQKLVLMLGKIDDVDEVYINGELIGQTGEISDGHFWPYNEAYRALRGYIIPTHLMTQTSQITIAVRVQDRMQTGGIYEGPVGIITMDKYIEYWHTKSGK